MAKVDCKIVEQEVNEMFEEHKTTQGVVEALLMSVERTAGAGPNRQRQFFVRVFRNLESLLCVES